MKPDDMDRRGVVKGLVLSPAILPLFAPDAVAAAAYAPKCFSASELELVATLGELILPQTDTPGARAAKVHEHIDLVLSEETTQVRQAFREGLALVDRRSRELYKRSFQALSPEEQNAVLTRMAGSKTQHPENDDDARRFFLELRKRVVFAYYTSEIGLRQELAYKGKQVLGHWEGCPHADRHGDSE